MWLNPVRATVDGSEIRLTSWGLVVYPIIYRVLWSLWYDCLNVYCLPLLTYQNAQLPWHTLAPTLGFRWSMLQKLSHRFLQRCWIGQRSPLQAKELDSDGWEPPWWHMEIQWCWDDFMWKRSFPSEGHSAEEKTRSIAVDSHCDLTCADTWSFQIWVVGFLLQKVSKARWIVWKGLKNMSGIVRIGEVFHEVWERYACTFQHHSNQRILNLETNSCGLGLQRPGKTAATSWWHTTSCHHMSITCHPNPSRKLHIHLIFEAYVLETFWDKTQDISISTVQHGWSSHGGSNHCRV